MPRLYETWPGRNRFMCCCVAGPLRDIGGYIYIFVCFAAAIIPFSIVIFQVNWAITPAIPILFYVFVGLALIFLHLTICTDPGIIPRYPYLIRDKEKFKNYL